MIWIVRPFFVVSRLADLGFQSLKMKAGQADLEKLPTLKQLNSETASPIVRQPIKELKAQQTESVWIPRRTGHHHCRP
jgi:hypothetical protein